MKNLTKKDVYVKIDTSNVAEVAKLLDSAGEELYNKQSCLSGEVKGYRSIILSDNGEWTRTTDAGDKTEVTLEQLAEILGVKQQFKVGDRVRIKESSQYYKYNETYNPRNVIGAICQLYDYGRIQVEWDVNRKNSYLPEDLELVRAGKETIIETVSVSRANLGRLYPIVCSSWQSYITSLLDDAGRFAVEVQVPLEKLKQAYKAADNKQKAILIEVAPLPKVKSTVNVSRWINLYDDGSYSMAYRIEKDAIRNKAQISYIDTIELTGEYTTEVEDPLMDLDEITF